MGQRVYGITNAMAQHIGVFSLLEIGKLISQFKGRHTTVSKRSILGNDLIPNASGSRYNSSFEFAFLYLWNIPFHSS